MRLWNVFIKSVREQKRDLWVVALSLAFAPLFVFIYYLMTGGTGTTSYNVLVINQDVPVTLSDSDGTTFSAGNEVVESLRGIAYQNGSPLLRVTLIDDRADAEQKIRDRTAAALVIIPEDFSAQLSAFRSGDTSAKTDLTFIGDLPYPYVPGLLVLAVVLMVFQAAMTPARDIESGAMRRLRLTPLTAFDYLGGTSLWLALVSIGAVFLTFATAVAFGFRSQGPLWLAVLVTAITSLSIIGIGLIVACFSKTVSQAFVIANFPLGFLMFLTGAAFPLPRFTLFTIAGRGFALPDLLPPTHAVVALNKILTLGAGFKDVAFELTALTLLSALYFGIGVWLFQRTQMRTR